MSVLTAVLHKKVFVEDKEPYFEHSIKKTAHYDKVIADSPTVTR